MKHGNTIIDSIKYKKRDEELAPDWRRRAAVVDGTQLWSAAPTVVLVQPRAVNNNGGGDNELSDEFTSSLVVDTPPFRRLKKNSSVRLLRISPDFASFLSGENEASRRLSTEKSRGGYKTPSGVLEDDDLLKLRCNLKKTWDFEDIIREIESDSFRVSTPPNDLLYPPSPDPDSFASDDVFIEIPLQGENQEETKVENTEQVERRNNESKEALSKLFDQLITDIYNQRLYPTASSCSFDEPRRCSETKLVEIRRWEGKRIFRQLSFPGHDAIDHRGQSHCQPPLVRSFSGVNKSNPGVEEFVDFTGDRYGRHRQDKIDKLTYEELNAMDIGDVEEIRSCLEKEIAYAGACLVEELKEKDALVSDQEGLCEIVTAYLQAISTKTSDDAKVQFSLSPAATDSSGFQEWARAMRMVARLPDGVPAHFRKNLWLSLAERHLNSKGIVWNQIERRLFSDTTTPEDTELSVQIVKDLHRTGCSLFCGVTGQHNQAVLKRVLVAYARWNKNVGYCQGLNMLAAIILQVMQGSQSATVKVMIYLIEGVLPESYFANNLRGLSVDMAVFRDLLRLKLPKLSKHLDHLQQDSKESGTSYEPPLCDVFTMQWFLTLFSNCLPQPTVLRVWDLVFLEGDHVLLKTSLAIWQCLSDRLIGVRSADEFYSIMAVMTREMMEFGLMEPNNLIKAIDNMAVPEVPELREKYIYNISPWAVGTVAKMGVKLLYPDVTSSGADDSKEAKATPFSNHPDREKIALDISALKRQYWKLRERQRQAHIILTACRSETLTANNSPALNHLLLGKRALLSAKGRRIEGTVPQPMNRVPRQQQQQQLGGGQKPRGTPSAGNQQAKQPGSVSPVVKESGTTIHWRQTRSRRGGTSRSPTPSSASSSASSSSSSTELCDSSSDSEEFLPSEEKNQVEVVPEVSDEAHVDKQMTEETNERTSPEIVEESAGKYEETQDQTEKKKSELALLQILQENSEILQRIHKSHNNRSNSGDETDANYTKKVAATSRPFVGRRDSGSAVQSPEEPDDIKDIRRRYAVRQTSSLDSPNPSSPSSRLMTNRHLDGATSSSSLPTVPTPSSPVFKPFPTVKAKHTEAGVQLGLYSSNNSTS